MGVKKKIKAWNSDTEEEDEQKRWSGDFGEEETKNRKEKHGMV